MNDSNDEEETWKDCRLWQTKLSARILDPIEKSLELLNGSAEHNNDNHETLASLLGLANIANDNFNHVQRANIWSAAADRPQWPRQETDEHWAQVRWSEQPVLVHPLTGEQFDLKQYIELNDAELQNIRQRSFEHFSSLLKKLGPLKDEQDWKKALLAFWRFGPELIEEKDSDKLSAIWRLLPADTRVPDHSIWDHLDLTSAFAGAFSATPSGEIALLTLSIGPIQPFIASARKIEDLWAGSHLLSRLAWEAMKPVCEMLGPDAILFPRLRGIPQVDLWLRDECKLPGNLFKNCEWSKDTTDSNPLFSAALPNRFVAVVPKSQAKNIVLTIETQVRQWLQTQGNEVVNRLLEIANLATDGEQYCHQQMRDQLEDFPEVHWAVVPFSLILANNIEGQNGLNVSALSAAMAPFFGTEVEQPSGFLDSSAWKLLANELMLEDSNGKKSVFFVPNPGVLYPAVYDLSERVLAAAKSVRSFSQIKQKQKGWRCSMTGETEWLTTNDKQLEKSYRRQIDSLWAKVATAKPAWAKKGEHLGALPAIKRLWPTLFADEVKKVLGSNSGIDRLVVSTHTMALAHQLDQWLERGGLTVQGLEPPTQEKYCTEAVALPRKLMRKYANKKAMLNDARRIPGLLDVAMQEDISDSDSSKIKRLVCRTLAIGQEKGEEVRLETYYALIMMDGDHIGAWLSGDNDYDISYRDSFHPQILKGFDDLAKREIHIYQYGEQKRALSPNRHLAISGALNDFSLTVVRHIVEEEHLGRVIYAGGDDVLAMLPVADLLPTMQRLRNAYSGIGDETDTDGMKLKLCNGFALLDNSRVAKQQIKMMRMMGRKATASCGAVIAHHQAPLGMVRRELAAAELRAKNEGGRDAFSITIIKRSGGILRFTAKWGEPAVLLNDLKKFLADEGVSRRAVYHILEWLKEQELPVPEDGNMLKALLAYQLDRQADKHVKQQVPGLAERLTALVLTQTKDNRIPWLRNFLSVVEFLAREIRAGGGA